jgi:chorismate mutase/prephenate dehydratase
MSLEDLRRQIDRIDEQLVELLNARARVVVEIGKHKAACGTPVYAPDREREILARIHSLNAGPLPDRALDAVYRELMSGSFALERCLRIAFLGPPGSFSHVAAREKFGGSVEYRPVKDIRSVFEEVARERADFGLVPVENTIGGGVVDGIDPFFEFDVHVCAEICQPVHQNLMARCSLADVKAVYSKPVVFTQCQRWLAANTLGEKLVGVASTSEAARRAADEPGAAAIANDLAAELYGLTIIADRIEDNPNNQTRFVVIGRLPAGRTGDDKTAIVFTTAHKPGALVDVLAVFRDHGVNLTLIESRPSGTKNWEYRFFIDVQGHASDAPVAQAIEKARSLCLSLTVLGSYPRATASG